MPGYDRVDRQAEELKRGLDSVIRKQVKEMLKALKSATGFIRHALGQEIIMRSIPELQFVADDSIAYSVHIASLLRDISHKDEEQEEKNDD